MTGMPNVHIDIDLAVQKEKLVECVKAESEEKPE